VKVRAAVLSKFNEPLEMREFSTTPLAPGEVLVKIAAAGICGSDVHMWRAKDPRTPVPIILGHEGVGTVAEIGGTKTDLFGRELKEGDLVLWERGIMCGRCYACVILKRPALCATRKTYGISVSCEEPPHLQGCYAEHLHVGANQNFIRIDKKIDPAVLVPATCSGATAAHTIEQSGIRPGDNIVVIGPGPLGLFVMAMARNRGASMIIVMGTAADEGRLELCKEFGANLTMVVDKIKLADRVAEVKKLTWGVGANVVIECTGVRKAAEEALHFAAPGGTVMIPGIATPVGHAPVSLYEHLARWNIRLQGVWVSDTSHLRQAAKLVLAKKFPFEKIITHRFKLEEATEALKTVERREAMKAVLVP